MHDPAARPGEPTNDFAACSTRVDAGHPIGVLKRRVVSGPGPPRLGGAPDEVGGALRGGGIRHNYPPQYALAGIRWSRRSVSGRVAIPQDVDRMAVRW
jgi:hypothetical protein